MSVRLTIVTYVTRILGIRINSVLLTILLKS